jgi:uncharacterized protein YybS (DUF2232 family)
MNYRAALLAGLQASALFLAGVIPFVGQVAALFTPVPFVIAYVRFGRREGFAAMALACLIAALIEPQGAILLFFSFGLMAVGISEAMIRKAAPERAVIAGTLLPLAALVPALGAYFINLGKNPLQAAEEYVHASLAEAAKLYSGMGLTEVSSTISSTPEAFIHYLVRLLPGLVIALSLVQAAACFGFARTVIARSQGTGPAQPPFPAWHAPDTWVWALIVALALVIIPEETTRIIGWNAAIVLGLVYTVQGMAILDYYFRKGGIHTLVRTLLHALILALPIVVCVTALGVVDIWADFRKLRVSVTH